MELSPRELALKAAQILSEKKASDIEILEIGDLTVLAEYFVICTGTSSTQVRSLAEELEFRLSELGIEPHHIEGCSTTRRWLSMCFTRSQGSFTGSSTCGLTQSALTCRSRHSRNPK